MKEKSDKIAILQKQMIQQIPCQFFFFSYLFDLFESINKERINMVVYQLSSFKTVFIIEDKQTLKALHIFLNQLDRETFLHIYIKVEEISDDTLSSIFDVWNALKRLKQITYHAYTEDSSLCVLFFRY